MNVKKLQKFNSNANTLNETHIGNNDDKNSYDVSNAPSMLNAFTRMNAHTNRYALS